MSEPRKYQHLSANFFRGSVAGQITSVYKDRVSNPAKLADYKAALAANDTNLGDTITRQQATKLADMGIDVPATVTIKQNVRKAA